MSRVSKNDIATIKEGIRRCKFILSVGTHAESPLLPDFSRLLELTLESVQLAELATQDNERLKTQLAEMTRSLDLASRIDPLTGLANRRDIAEKITQEHSRAQRHQRTYSIIMADIDNFKQINDTYGLNCGDDVLFELSCLLRECVRSEDFCSRWGGEEFLFLLPETGIDGALSVANKIIQSVAMTEFKANKPGIRLTVSLGISEYQAGQTVNDCLKKVEQALLQAKDSGKNCYIAAS